MQHASQLRQKSQQCGVSLFNGRNLPYTVTIDSQSNGWRNVFLIIDTLANMDFYKNLNEAPYKGLRFLRETDLATFPVGRYEIDGDAVFALVQEYETHLPEECRWEAHYTYTDIQYIVEGSEKMGWKALDDVVKTEDRPEDDIYFFDAEGDHFVLHAGQFAVFAPQDAHRPGLAVDGPTPVKKIVVKVAM